MPMRRPARSSSRVSARLSCMGRRACEAERIRVRRSREPGAGPRTSVVPRSTSAVVVGRRLRSRRRRRRPLRFQPPTGLGPSRAAQLRCGRSWLSRRGSRSRGSSGRPPRAWSSRGGRVRRRRRGGSRVRRGECPRQGGGPTRRRPLTRRRLTRSLRRPTRSLRRPGRRRCRVLGLRRRRRHGGRVPRQDPLRACLFATISSVGLARGGRPASSGTARAAVPFSILWPGGHESCWRARVGSAF